MTEIREEQKNWRDDKKVITREEAIKVLNDCGEHRFFYGVDDNGTGNTPVYIVDVTRDRQVPSRSHKEIAEGMVNEHNIPIENIRVGGCGVLGKELDYWGPASSLSESAQTDSEKFNEIVDKNGIVIFNPNQWLDK